MVRNPREPGRCCEEAQAARCFAVGGAESCKVCSKPQFAVAVLPCRHRERGACGHGLLPAWGPWLGVEHLGAGALTSIRGTAHGMVLVLREVFVGWSKTRGQQNAALAVAFVFCLGEVHQNFEVELDSCFHPSL